MGQHTMAFFQPPSKSSITSPFHKKKQVSKNSTSWASSPMTSISRANSTLKLLAFGGLKTNDQLLHGIGIVTYIYHRCKPHVGKPRTQMTLVLIRKGIKGLVLEGWSPKIEDKQVPGKYTSPMEHIWVMIRVCEVHIPLCWTPQKQVDETPLFRHLLKVILILKTLQQGDK